MSQPMPFVKIFGHRMMTSTLWLESPDVVKLFVCLLCSADDQGFVDIQDERALAQRAALTVEQTAKALAILEAPDPRSRVKAHDGRRICRVEVPAPGWYVVNATRYRAAQTIHQAMDAERKRKGRKQAPRTPKRAKPIPVPENPAAAEAEDMAWTKDKPDRDADSYDRTHGVGGSSWGAPKRQAP